MSINLKDKIETLRMKWGMNHREIVAWLIRGGYAKSKKKADELLMQVDHGGDG
tara:strand:+ start:18355 stop:18513 length:159 start_codon:yes stop_codon:yes gene_type:complete